MHVLVRELYGDLFQFMMCFRPIYDTKIKNRGRDAQELHLDFWWSTCDSRNHLSSHFFRLSIVRAFWNDEIQHTTHNSATAAVVSILVQRHHAQFTAAAC